MSTPYPFTAIVGMDDLRLALLLNAVSPAVGGVLVRGEKGTAKSTAVRALSALHAGGRGRRRVPVLVRPRVARTRRAPTGRTRPGGGVRAARADGRAARRRLRGPARRRARHRAGAGRGREGLRAGAARRRAPRDPLRRRGQPAPRPPGRPAARRGRHGRLVRRARRRLRTARRAVPARRDHEPRRGRAAAAVARPVRADRRGRGLAGARSAGGGRAAAARVRRRSGRLRRAVGGRGGRRCGRGSWPRGRCCRRCGWATGRCGRSPRPVRPSRWTACAPTS